MMSFNSVIFLGLLLRIFFVISGSVLAVREIGFDNMSFLKGYIKKRAFETHKILLWFVSFVTLIYFENLISEADPVTLTEAFSKNWILVILVVFLLLWVNYYAFSEASQSIVDAKNTKKELEKAKNWKGVLNVVHFASWFVPSGIFVKAGLFSASLFAHSYVDGEIENKVSDTIMKNIKIMIFIVLVNLSIVLISVYLITDKIMFW